MGGLSLIELERTVGKIGRGRDILKRYGDGETIRLKKKKGLLYFVKAN